MFRDSYHIKIREGADMLKIAVCGDRAEQLDKIERGVREYFSVRPQHEAQDGVFTALAPLNPPA